MFRKLNNQIGFTLVEMLVVIMIISVLIILIIPNLSGKNEDITKKGCEALVAVVQAQVDSYYLDEGKYPQDLDELMGDKYITEDQMSCPNGDDLIYNSPGKVTPPIGNE